MWAMHTGYAYGLCIRAMHTGCACGLCMRAVHTGCAYGDSGGRTCSTRPDRTPRSEEGSGSNSSRRKTRTFPSVPSASSSAAGHSGDAGGHADTPWPGRRAGSARGRESAGQGRPRQRGERGGWADRRPIPGARRPGTPPRACSASPRLTANLPAVPADPVGCSQRRRRADAEEHIARRPRPMDSRSSTSSAAHSSSS